MIEAKGVIFVVCFMAFVLSFCVIGVNRAAFSPNPHIDHSDSKQSAIDLYKKVDPQDDRLQTRHVKEFPEIWADVETPEAIVMFGSTWCGPCRLQKPELKAKSAEYSIVFIDVDANPTTFSIANSTGIPTTIVLNRNGNVAKKWVGYVDWKSIEPFSKGAKK